MPLWSRAGQRQRLPVARPWPRGHREPTEDELRQALSDVVSALGLNPFGAATVQAVPIRVEGAPVQYTIIGLLPAEPDVARARVLDALRGVRFHLRRHGPVAEFLRWQATAVRGRITLTAAVGADADDDDTPFRHLRDGSYVQLTVL